MLPLKRVPHAAFVAGIIVAGCAWPPFQARVVEDRRLQPACAPCPSSGAQANTEPAAQPSSKLQPPAGAARSVALAAALGASAGVRFVRAEPGPPEAPPFLLGTTALSPLGAATFTAFNDGKAPPLPQGTTVLHIGDSFAGALGIPLRDELARHGIKSPLRFQTASYIPTWAFHKKLPLYILSYKPDLVLVTLGGNELAIQDPNQRAGAIRRLVKHFEDRPCVWIVPPLWAAENGLTQVIRDNCAPCQFMDTNALIREMPRVRDGIHPSAEARQEWAKLVLAWLATHRTPDAERPWELRGD